MVQVRAVKDTDNFNMIYKLVNDTSQHFGSKTGVVWGDGEEFKKVYGDPNSPSKGFLVEEGNSIVAFMGVTPSKTTKNAVIEYGFLDGYENTLDELLPACITFIQENGGNKITKYTWTQFGQVRSKEITLWERLGFTSDEYSLITTMLDLRDWKEPQGFDAAGIEPAVEMDYDDIKEMLMEDGEEEMAELFQLQHPSTKKPDQVVLTLKDKDTDVIAGIAYYRVYMANTGTDNEFLDALSFGVHIRPQYQGSRGEIKRFVQGCLVSMKQLELVHVITRITLKNFNVFSAMVAEGFHNEGLENANLLRLYRNI